MGKISSFIYVACLFINMLLSFLILSLAPDESGSMAAWAFIAIFSVVAEMFIIQSIAVFIGFCLLKHKKMTIVLIIINILILIATAIRFFI